MAVEQDGFKMSLLNIVTNALQEIKEQNHNALKNLETKLLKKNRMSDPLYDYPDLIGVTVIADRIAGCQVNTVYRRMHSLGFKKIDGNYTKEQVRIAYFTPTEKRNGLAEAYNRQNNT